MCDIPVLYATSEGQTQRIAQRIAARLREIGFDSEAISVTDERASKLHWERVRAVILGASLHAGRHQHSAAAFARSHSEQLNGRWSAFFSVSLAAASKNPAEVDMARRLAEDFTRTLGWLPHCIVCFAGRLAYRQYGFITRALMRVIARREGGSTDTSSDHEYTDWAAVTRFADDMARAVWKSESTGSTLARPAHT